MPLFALRLCSGGLNLTTDRKQVFMDDDSSDTNRRFAFELLRDSQILVSFQGAAAPHPSEVQEYRELMASLADKPDLRCLWFTEGGRLSLGEQERLTASVPKRHWRTALVSPSPEMRFVASVLLLANKNLRYFKPEELPQALRHLQCTREEQHAAQIMLAELRYAVERSTQKTSGGLHHPELRSERRV